MRDNQYLIPTLTALQTPLTRVRFEPCCFSAPKRLTDVTKRWYSLPPSAIFAVKGIKPQHSFNIRILLVFSWIQSGLEGRHVNASLSQVALPPHMELVIAYTLTTWPLRLHSTSHLFTQETNGSPPIETLHDLQYNSSSMELLWEAYWLTACRLSLRFLMIEP